MTSSATAVSTPTQPAGGALLRVESVDASYGRFQVLRDVNLSVARSEIVALIGANGAGKSTVLRVIAGFCKPRSGTIRLRDEPIAGMRPHEVLARGCCYVAQGQDLFPQMTVADNVEMGGYLIRDATRRRERRDECLELFPALAAKVRMRAHGLSGGERQQLKIARAFMTQPELLLLDEPSAGLSPKLVDEVFAELTELLRSTGVGALVVEQNVAKALAVADTVCVLDRGHVALCGSPADLGGVDAIRDVYLGVTPPSQPERP